MTTLRFNAAAIKLAEAIWHARAEAYGIAVPSFSELQPCEKQHYVEHAADVLEAVRPVLTYRGSYFEYFVGVTRTHGRKVVGAIEPAGERR